MATHGAYLINPAGRRVHVVHSRVESLLQQGYEHAPEKPAAEPAAPPTEEEGGLTDDLEARIMALDYSSEMRPLALAVAEDMGVELESQKKTDLAEFLFAHPEKTAEFIGEYEGTGDEEE